MINAVHSGSLNVLAGGPALSTYLTLKGLEGEGVDVGMVMAPIGENGRLIGDDVRIAFTQMPLERRFEYMRGVKGVLDGIGRADVYHVQGIWQYLGHRLAAYARKLGVPYVVTLRGMLYPQALAKSRLVKSISMWLYQRRDLEGAACVQVTCREELEHYRALGFRNPVAIIPNPIDTEGIVERRVVTPDRLRFGYLGRIHRRKRIERLIYAFDKLRGTLGDAELLIIGGGDDEYEGVLKGEVKRLGLGNVRFTGFLSGREKDEAICSLSYLVVPSDFENFGNIVNEALVRGVPVIASKGTPWEILEQEGCGWWIENDQESINLAMEKAAGVSEIERVRMGERGKRVVEDNFSVGALGHKMARLYRWLTGEGERPEFVYDCRRAVGHRQESSSCSSTL